jgi:signal transduction histidine kinase
MIALALLLITAIYLLRLRGIHNRYRAVLEERKHIAREWHDTLLAGLSATAWQLDAAMHICTQPPLLKSLTNVSSMLRYCNAEARLAVDELRHESLEPTSIVKTMREMLQQLTRGTPVAFELKVDASLPQLSGNVSQSLLRVCQEAANNAIQHGKPSMISVSLDYAKSMATLCVHDDGLGMDPALVQSPLPGHFGLLGMRERVQRIGGEFDITTVSGQGTTVNAKVPVIA